MTEAEARAWIVERFGADAADRVEAFLALVVEENGRQNLIAPSTIETMWVRHALDSAQLVRFAQPGLWIDIGTGGGFPGMIVALLRPDPILMVEPRGRRGDFLAACIERLSIPNAITTMAKIETVSEVAAVISARAVAPIEKLLQIAAGCANTATRWLLPRGRLDEAELGGLRRRWRGVFHVEQSVTDPGSSFLVLDGIARR